MSRHTAAYQGRYRLGYQANAAGALHTQSHSAWRLHQTKTENETSSRAKGNVEQHMFLVTCILEQGNRLRVISLPTLNFNKRLPVFP